jgi:two-component system, NarL family, response regulator NreC
MLDHEQEIEVIGMASDLSGVVGQLHGRVPGVLILDLRLPNGSSIQAIRRLRAEAPGTEIVVITTEESPLFAQQAIDAGAIGFVLKDQADSELVTAIRCASRGDEYLSPRVAAGLTALQRAVGGDGLTPRETEVLRLIALGHTSVEIAAKLHLSRRTIETHRAKIHRKLGLTTRAELVRFALGRQLIT